jgi:hypothetical protein
MVYYTDPLSFIVAPLGQKKIFCPAWEHEIQEEKLGS